MFRQLASIIAGGIANPASAQQVLTARPSQLSEFLEHWWLFRAPNIFEGLPPAPVQPPGPQVPPVAADDVRLRTMGRAALLDVPPALAPVGGAVWPHLGYALMLDQTRMTSVFRRLLEMYISGELPIPSGETVNWIRATEELFFASPRLPSVFSLERHLRPDSGARRRNAYYRLLGIELTHGADDGRPYAYAKPEGANRDFVPVFEELLVEVWAAYTNRNNGIGPDTTDDLAMADLLRRLYEMLTTRRLHGTLSREEFEAVALLSWFDLTLSFDTAITNDLVAQGSSATERLMKIAQRVGVPAHSRTDSYVQMAMPFSNILRGIESGAITGIAGAQSLYLLPGPNQLDTLTLIRHWSITTGRNLKDRAARLAGGAPVTAAGRNGSAAMRTDVTMAAR